MVWNAIIINFISHVEIISFAAAFAFGMETVFLLGFLSGHGLSPYWKVLVFAYLGYFFFEMMWFLVARSKIADWAKKNKKTRSFYKHTVNSIKKITRGNHFFELFLAKIAYGFGTMLLVYLSRRTKLRKLLVYNAFVLLVTTILISGLGWMAGKSLSGVINVFENFKLIIGAIIAIILLFHASRVYLSKWIDKEK